MDLLIRAALRHGSGGRDLHGWDRRRLGLRQRRDVRRAEAEHADRARDVLHRLLAEVGEGERQLVPDLVIRGAGDAQTTRLAERFEARRNVHAVAEDVIAVDDDVADVDPDPKNDPLVFG